MKDDYVEKVLIQSKLIYDGSSASLENIEMFKNYPHMFVLGCIMDSQIKFEKAWEIPKIVGQAVGGLELSFFLSKDEKWYIDFFVKNKLHRFNEQMGRAFYKCVARIHNQYRDDATNIWNDNPSSAELVYRFLEFEKAGIKIATMAANILSRDYKVPLKDYYAIDISPDIHVKRTMYRLGFLEPQDDVNFSEIDATKVIYRAKSINPVFPGLLDLAFWKIGQEKICTNTECNSINCPFGHFCLKQGF